MESALVVLMCQELQDLLAKGFSLAVGPAACGLLLLQELLQGFDNSPQGMGCLWDGGRCTVEGVSVVSALLSEVWRDR